MFFESCVRALMLARKELMSIATNRLALVSLFIPPIMQLIIFSFAISQEVTNARIVALNLDVGAEGESLMKAFNVRPIFREVLRVGSYRELDEALENQRALAGIVIPQDFSRSLLDPKGTATVQITLDGRRANASGILGGYISQIVSSHKVEATAEVSTRGLATRRWFNPNLIARTGFLPGLACIVMTSVAMIASAPLISRERETGTFDQLVVSPFSPTEIVFGKALAGLFLSSVAAAFALSIIVFGFKIPLKGPLWLFIASTELYLTSIVSIGLFISAMSTTEQQSTLGMFLFLPPAIMLSGFATPVENMPQILQSLTVINPVRWELVVLKGLLIRGSSTASILPNLIPLTAIAIVCVTAARVMFKRRME